MPFKYGGKNLEQWLPRLGPTRKRFRKLTDEMHKGIFMCVFDTVQTHKKGVM
jgi:hypothetical protein